MPIRNAAGTVMTMVSYTTSLANNTTEEPSGSPPVIWDVTPDRPVFANFQLEARFAATPSGSDFFRVWLLPSIDPLNNTYPDGSASFTPLVPPDLLFPIAALTTTQLISIPATLQLAPTKYKIVWRNTSGAAVSNAVPVILRAFVWSMEST